MSREEPVRGFSAEEYEARANAAQAGMSELGLDALLFTTEPEFRYFTGFQTAFWQSPTRPWYLLLPSSGGPIAVIPAIGRPLMETSWIDDVKTWPAPRPADDGIGLLADTLTDVVGATGSVGVPMGHETHLRMPLNDYQVLRNRVSGLAFEDATPLIRRLRMRKSEAEIVKLAHICSIASESFAIMSEIVSVGMTERDAFKAFRIALLELGADEVPYLVGATGRSFSSIIDRPSDRVIEPGDLMMFDTGATFDGYWCDFDRYFSFGEAEAEAQRAYQVVWAATQAGLESVKPGVTTTELWETMANVMTAAGGAEGNVGRLGHGLGMQLTEWPSITQDDGTPLTEGMVVTLEPGMSWAPGKTMVHEENLVVRQDGAQLLSARASNELPVL